MLKILLFEIERWTLKDKQYIILIEKNCYKYLTIYFKIIETI